MKGDAQQRPLSGAKRKTQSRQRRRDGFIGVIMLAVRQTEVTALIARGLLAKADRYNRRAIAAALGKLLDAAL